MLIVFAPLSEGGDKSSIDSKYFNSRIFSSSGRVRAQYVAESRIMRFALESEFNRLIDRLNIITLPKGKPVFEGECSDIGFSFSHSGKLVGGCFTFGAVGFDLQAEREISHSAMKFVGGAKTKEEFFKGFVGLESRGKLAGEGVFAARRAAEHSAAESVFSRCGDFIYGGEKYYWAANAKAEGGKCEGQTKEKIVFL